MNFNSFRGCCRFLWAALFFLFLVARPYRAAELLLLPGPQAAVPAAGQGGAVAPVRFTLYGLNRGTEPVAAEFPENVPCRVSAGGLGVEATARKIPGQGMPERVQPGMFAQAEYEVLPPGELAGRPLQVAPLLPTPAVPAVAAAGPAAPAAAGGGRLADKRLDVLRNFSPYESNYFIVGPKAPTTRFQLSFKFRVLGDCAGSTLTDWLGKPYVAYSQISLWDWSAPSAPFYDTSYKPEFFLLKEDVPLKLPGVRSWDFQYGAQHESNGKGIGLSRSQNIVYIKPIFNFGDPNRFHLALAPRIYQYVADMSDNRDMDDYRGFADLSAKMGWNDGLMLGALVRSGNGFKNSSTQLDLSYPLHRLPGCENVSTNLYLFLQLFSGYGECLLDYDKSVTGIRAGFAISR